MKPSRVLTIAIVLSIYGLTGCAAFVGGGGGDVTVRSLVNEQTYLKSGFTKGIYRYDDKSQITVVLYDGSLEEPTQVMTIRLFWKPRAGSTPIDPNATNASIHHVIFAGDDRGEVGIYSGAGYVYPSGKFGKESLNGSVWQATLTMADHSDRFNDLLGQSTVKGDFAVRRDDAGVDRALKQLNILISERLGYPRLVREAPPACDTIRSCDL